MLLLGHCYWHDGGADYGVPVANLAASSSTSTPSRTLTSVTKARIFYTDLLHSLS